MRRNRFWETRLLIVVLVGGCVTTDVESAPQPNIILCLADDLGWADVGFNGNTIIQTPQLDAWQQSCRRSLSGSDYAK